MHPPVGDNKTLIAPFAPQNIGDQLIVVVAPNAVDQIIAGHEAQGVGFLYADFKALEVDFPLCPLGQPGVALVAAGFLVVAGIVLGAGGHALTLDTPHHGGGDFAGEQGVFGVVFKVPSAQGVAVDVHAGAEQHLASLGKHLLAHQGV